MVELINSVLEEIQKSVMYRIFCFGAGDLLWSLIITKCSPEKCLVPGGGVYGQETTQLRIRWFKFCGDSLGKRMQCHDFSGFV